MSTREVLTLVLQATTPLLLAVFGLFLAWLQRKVSAATKNQQLLSAVDLIAHGAQGVVAELAQSVVKDLKDPNKPGSWDKVTQESVKATAIRRLQELYPHAIAELQQSNPDKVSAMVGTFVEAAVLKYKKP
jgi:hypothetical protein